MYYSFSSVQEALSANNQRGKLHRELITVGDAINSEIRERIEIFMTEHQGDNMTSSL